jgi:hypothetical protein
MEASVNAYIQEILKELEEENLSIFAGAGLSVAAGYVDWKKLLKPAAIELNLDIDKETDLVSLAQYHCNENAGNRDFLNKVILDAFSDNHKITDNHKILSRLPIQSYWTTNYDKLIETALEQAGKIPDIKYTENHLATTKPRRNCIVYKMHGDIEHPSEAILIKDDYESYYLKRSAFLTALAGELVSKTFLFIGFSFTDPNLDYILSRVRVSYKNNQRRHFCFLRKVKQGVNEEAADFEYRKRKQQYFIDDLLRFNIKTILVDEYEDITEILLAIERKYSQRTVFISGAAHEYGSWTKEEADNFIHTLSGTLIERGYKIVSGFGLGVGSAVISGSLEQIYMGQNRKPPERLILKPFPQEVFGEQDRTKMWQEYRNTMISCAGISIFLFGNKKNNGGVILSDGMRQEFETAKEKGLFLLPIGSTGYMAKQLWEEINTNFDSYNPNCNPILKTKFNELENDFNDKTTLIKLILDIIDLL